MIGYLDSLESDLRAGKDRSSEIDELFQMTLCADDAVKERVSWCLAKMAQNKCADIRIHVILLSLRGSSQEVLENVAWGLGELAGRGTGDDSSLDLLKILMKHQSSSVRSMAAWATGRCHRKLGLFDAESMSILESLRDDKSQLVRRSAEFAIDGD